MRVYVGRLLAALETYARIGWWGLVSPRVSESGPLIVVQAVILIDGRILLGVRSDLWGWELPGGNLHAWEEFEAGLRREVREETGLDVVVERFVGDYHRSGFRPHIAKVYRCRVIGGELQTNDEVLELRTFDPTDLPRSLFPWYRAPIHHALRDDPTPIVQHDRQGISTILEAIRIDLRMRLDRRG